MEINIEKLATEERNINTMNIDNVSTEEMIKMINEEDKKVTEAVENVIPHIVNAVDKIAEKLMNGGRLFYLGAGTSGRLGVLDASECPPTFGTPRDMVQGIIAGGPEAVFRGIEGIEDSSEDAIKDLKKIGFNEKDVLVGITASGRTPYVLSAIEFAKEKGAISIAVTNNPDSEIEKISDICISAVVGQEVLTGSTRMKSGTAQKMVLNMLSTGAMIKLGKAYENLMVDVQASNQKLVERCKRIVIQATDVKKDEASKYLDITNYNVKLAIFMIKSQLEKDKAQKVLELYSGHIRKALQSLNHQNLDKMIQ